MIWDALINVHVYAVAYQGPPSRPSVQKIDRQPDRQTNRFRPRRMQTQHLPLIPP